MGDDMTQLSGRPERLCDVVALVGSPGSGKTTVAEYLATRGYAFFSISEVRRTIAVAGSIDPNDFNRMQKFTDEFYAVRGRGIFTEIAFLNIEGRGVRRAVLEGLRYAESVEAARAFCKKRQWRLHCIGLQVTTTLATGRIISRGRKRDPQSAAAIHEYAATAGRNAKLALDVCDIVIANDSTIANLIKQVTETMVEAFGVDSPE
jgi:adenylate kinase family enzyme